MFSTLRESDNLERRLIEKSENLKKELSERFDWNFEFEDDEENIFSVSSIITIVSISVALILAIIIIIVVMKHKQMRDKLLRSRKLSRVTGGGVMSRVSASGVKVLPDYLFSPTPVDESECKVTGPQFAPNIFLRFTQDLKNIKVTENSLCFLF